MAKYTHAFVIPDQGAMKGGVLYDKFGNLEYFADVSGLQDKTKTGADKQVQVGSQTVHRFMNSNGTFTRAATIRSLSVGLRQPKGALPGYTVTLESDKELPGDEKRQFQYTGTMSALVAWLKTTAKMEVWLYGPTGTPYDGIPAATP